MKSICIKTNNSESLNYLLNELKYINIEDLYYSKKTFKHYDNIIIHYKGIDNKLFLSKIASLLSYLIIDEKEDDLLKKIISTNYFYFDEHEQKKIIDLCFDIMIDNLSIFFNNKFNELFDSFYNYLCYNKSIFLEGFINFRIKKYISILDNIVNEAVNSYIIEKEYLEFISLLKIYINSKDSSCNEVHLIYSNDESVLLDENKNVVITTDKMLDAKFLSDISFSSNDYILNSLLTLLPRRIYIHLTDNFTDDFINTLRLIFENRINLCTDCNLCNLYKLSKKNLK